MKLKYLKISVKLRKKELYLQNFYLVIEFNEN